MNSEADKGVLIPGHSTDRYIMTGPVPGITAKRRILVVEDELE